ncbi:MAG: P-loop NTPase fold protein [Polyangiaceae bacterium]
MWSDNESDVDLLGYSHLVQTVVSIVNTESLLPATIGIFGDWGSGKSSLMKMAGVELSQDKAVLVLPFNGWLFEGYEDAKTALMGTILDELAKRQGLSEKAKGLVGRLLSRINWMRALGLAAKGALSYLAGGLPALGLTAGAELGTHAVEAAGKLGSVDVDEAAKFVKSEPAQELRRGIREFRTDFGELLKEAKIKTLVVMIDDLDRCMPDTIVETLEAIKLFLFVPQTAFIVGADERLVKYAVRRRFPELPGERAEVGRDYLEKLIQFPICIPPLGRPETETYINLLFAKDGGLVPGAFDAIRRAAVDECSAEALLEVRFNYGIAQKILGDVPKGLAENLELAQRIAPILATGLNGNPRQCKRFLNTLAMRIEMAKLRRVTLKSRVLAKLMLLEYFRPDSFKKLAEAQAEQAGRSAELASAEQAARPQPRVQPKPAAPPPPADGAGGKRLPPRPATPTTDSVAAESATPLPVWLSDDVWIDGWLRLEPPLSGEDLQPYFFFSRDKLGALGGSVQRMSPAAQEVLANLLQKSEAVRRVALKKAAQVSSADAAAVFEALGDRIRQEEDPSDPDAPVLRMLEWVEARLDLFGQLATLLQTLPPTGIPISAVPKIINMAGSDEARRRLARDILSRLAQDASPRPLKNAASMQLAKLQ